MNRTQTYREMMANLQVNLGRADTQMTSLKQKLEAEGPLLESMKAYGAMCYAMGKITGRIEAYEQAIQLELHIARIDAARLANDLVLPEQPTNVIPLKKPEIVIP